jgi:hypothetical protein
LGFLFPPSAIFLTVGVAVGLLAGQLAGPSDWLLGFLPAFLVCGTVASAFHRYVASVVSSAVGAWLLVIGLLAALHQAGGVVASVAAQPWGVVLAAAFFAVAGAVYQIAVRPTPEEALRLKQERARVKQKVEEKRALEKRWAHYSDRK